MKKILSLAVLMAVCLSAQAQFYLGGSLGYETQTTKVDHPSTSSTTTEFSLAPEFGYSIDEVWSVGAECELGFINQPGDTNDAVVYSIAPYVRANFAHVGPVHFFAKAYTGFGIARIDDNNWSSWTIGFGPGFSVPLSERCHLETSFPLFNFSKLSDDVDIKTTTFQINNGVKLGLIVYL